MTDKKDTYCPTPWHGGFLTYHEQSVCCGYKSLKTSSIVEFYRSDLVRQLKHDLIAGTPDERCQSQCFDLEAIGSKSHRQIYLENFPLSDIEFNYDPDGESVPQYIEVRLGNLCNFKCRICKPTWSNQIGKEVTQNPTLTKFYQLDSDSLLDRSNRDSKLISEIIDMIPQLRWLYFTGGEPMLIPDVLTILDAVEAQGCSGNITLQLTTNVSTVNPKIVDRFKQLKKVQITTSIDAIGAAGEYARHGTIWDKVSANMEYYGQLSLEHKNIDVNPNLALSAYNVLVADELVEYLCDYTERYRCVSLDMSLVTGLLHPEVLVGQLRARAIDRLGKALLILERRIESGMKYDPNSSRKHQLVWNQFNAMRNELISKPEDDSAYQQFKQFTIETDSVRGENFAEVFGIELE
jgi:organic radical activating enzyme